MASHSIREPRLFALCAAVVASALSGPAFGQQVRADYTIQVQDTANHLFHVSATFSDLTRPWLDVALPVWTPGVYDAANYATNVRRFFAYDPSGRRLHAPKVAASTWRIATAGSSRVVVEFDYIATDLSWNGAAITPQFAFFTGTQLFLEPVGHRDAPATVRFMLPERWRVVSALRETADSSVFAARGYDELADAPTVLGSFDVTTFDAEGKPHVIVRAPAGTQCADDFQHLVNTLPRIVRVDRAIFGSLPYEKYVVFCIAGLQGGALEHANSYVSSWLDPVSFAHEFFHLWNVKRIRPAEMWPYDYSRVNPGPSLWVSEGITSYYEALTAYRAHVEQIWATPTEGAGAEVAPPARAPELALLDHFGYRLSGIESDPERQYVSPSDASLSDGLQYGAVSPSYYNTGEVLGLLLDLSILRDTEGRRGLDDVMRALYKQHYARNRGFSPDDLVRIVSATAGKDYSEFFSRYVTGIEIPPYDSLFAYAGYSVTRSSRSLGVLGLAARSTPEGRLVYLIRNLASSPAARAGLRVGDLIVAIDGIPIHEVPLANLFGKNWIGGWLPGRAGERVVVTVVRNDNRLSVPVTLDTRREAVFHIEPDSAATPQQIAVRRAWLRQ